MRLLGGPSSFEPAKVYMRQLRIAMEDDAAEKPASARLYDRISTWYDLIAGTCEKRLREEGLRLLDAKEGEGVLEIGAGTGHGLAEIARAVGDSGKASGIDISPRMIEIARTRAAASGLASRIELRCADASTLPYTAGRFDAIFMSFTLETFDERGSRDLLAECSRVLKPEGRICVVAMSKRGKRGPLMRLYEWSHARFPGVIDCRPIDAGDLLKAGFDVPRHRVRSFWGLSVELVLAVKKPDAR